MKQKIHPVVAVALIVLAVIGAGVYLTRLMSSGVVGKEYRPGEKPFVNRDLDTPEDETARDAARTGDPDGK